jgi:acetyl-CoA acetyltransferase
MPGSVIVGGARTPIGKLAGALKNLTAMVWVPATLSRPLNRVLAAPEAATTARSPRQHDRSLWPYDSVT